MKRSLSLLGAAAFLVLTLAYGSEARARSEGAPLYTLDYLFESYSRFCATRLTISDGAIHYLNSGFQAQYACVDSPSEWSEVDFSGLNFERFQIDPNLMDKIRALHDSFTVEPSLASRKKHGCVQQEGISFARWVIHDSKLPGGSQVLANVDRSGFLTRQDSSNWDHFEALHRLVGRWVFVLQNPGFDDEIIWPVRVSSSRIVETTHVDTETNSLSIGFGDLTPDAWARPDQYVYHVGGDLERNGDLHLGSEDIDFHEDYKELSWSLSFGPSPERTFPVFERESFYTLADVRAFDAENVPHDVRWERRQRLANESPFAQRYLRVEQISPFGSQCLKYIITGRDQWSGRDQDAIHFELTSRVLSSFLRKLSKATGVPIPHGETFRAVKEEYYFPQE